MSSDISNTESNSKVSTKRNALLEHKLLQFVLDALPSITFLINRQRQILVGNRALLNSSGIGSIDQVIGVRPGEVFGCIHASENPSGCGHAEACKHCGAIKAVQESFRTNQPANEECLLIVERDGEKYPLDLSVSVTPLSIEQDYDVMMVVINDISDRKRRLALESIFFHDLLNTACGLRRVLEYLGKSSNGQRPQLFEKVQVATKLMVDEIMAQRDLTLAEAGELRPQLSSVNCREILEAAAVAVRSISEQRGIIVNLTGDESLDFESDSTLVGRILVNLLKNACEASSSGEKVSAGFISENGCIEFSVENSQAIPLEVQGQLFQRSFSTKGKNRGLGTYSIRLICERYLNGKVSFTSSKETGTSFRVRLPLKANRSSED